MAKSYLRMNTFTLSDNSSYIRAREGNHTIKRLMEIGKRVYS